MDSFLDDLTTRAATIDELLSDDFETSAAGKQGDAELARQRFAEWRRSSASADPSLFARRLERDGLDPAAVLARLTAARRKSNSPLPLWARDAAWILAALEGETERSPSEIPGLEPIAFEQLFAGMIASADGLLRSEVPSRAAAILQPAARDCLRHALLRQLSDLAAAAVYERFSMMRRAAGAADPATTGNGLKTSLYEKFVTDMKNGGFRKLFEEKPVLLRLMSVLTRQWIDTSREFILRLDADLPAIREVLNCDGAVSKIEEGIAEPHNGGRSVKIVTFADNSKILYKPKDLRIDVAWRSLVDRLNNANPPIDLMAARALARDRYGWTEYIEHVGCATQNEFKTFFRRVGSWLSLFHVFAANDMHQENMIASGSHPVPIDLETVLQSSIGEKKHPEPEDAAFDAAMDKLANSVLATGLLPTYGRAPDDKVFAMGGVTADWKTKIVIKWENINSDAMRPTRTKDVIDSNPNLPHVGGCYARFADHAEDLISGFEEYSRFLVSKGDVLFDGFAGLPVRKVIRATRFYAMLLQRLKNHKTMHEGPTWSAQADFMARLADWDMDDPLWAVQRAERAALLSLNIPHFVSDTDGHILRDWAGFRLQTDSTDGLTRARTRFNSFDAAEIDWQIEAIRVNTNSRGSGVELPGAPQRCDLAQAQEPPSDSIFGAEAQRAADELARNAIRRGSSAAWIGLDWLGDAEVFQLVPLGHDLYNGTSGIALFLSAHFAVTGQVMSHDLALAGVARLRKQLRSQNAPRFARSLGIGGGIGLGSIVYGLTVMAQCLGDPHLRIDAQRAAELINDDLIAADRRLDVIGGSAGAILCLLRLYRDVRSEVVLRRATSCGEHLLAQGRPGERGRRSWVGQGSGNRPLNGMSHGAAGFAYALASLAVASGREDFAEAAQECIDFENSTFSGQRSNWPDLRGADESWPCQWCHGAAGIGLGRIAMARLPRSDDALKGDVERAVEGTRAAWPSALDTLCCGTLGSIEFLSEAGDLLGRDDLSGLAKGHLAEVLELAARRGDYRWNSGDRRFNLGLFRGMAGVGYSALRVVDRSLPNVLIFE
ncbi:MAG TPA: type 2 lanthipeptide synthetase LanM family protein [Pseudolabrys sp.]|nr:type 2 lanthipeptide synthetase LanM family protein [Pseudolabrys sp.]